MVSTDLERKQDTAAVWWVSTNHRWARLVRPRPKLNVWQWADSVRYLARGVSAKSRHGNARYSTAAAPHQRGIMEAFTDPEVQTTVMVGASQVMGKTEVFNSVLGYFMDYRPGNAIVMYPTIDSAEKYSKKKFVPMCRATPVLDKLLPNSRSRDSGNTILVKEYVGGSIFFVGANSTSSLRGATGELLLADEIDSNEDSAGDEGDAVDLLWKRGESYPTAVQAVASTPTIEGQSRIWSWFEMSDQRFWFVPCKHCGTYGIFKWSQTSAIKVGPSYYVEWPEGKTTEAVIVCATCAKQLNDAQRLEMYFNGRWQPTAPFSGIRGFHLNWIYCPWPAKKGYRNRLHQMAEEWERAKKKGEQSLKVIVNTGLTETWKIKLEDAPDWKSLHLRVEDYATEIPDPVVYLTASVDTQADRLEYEIQGWGIGEECFGIKTGKLFGNPHLADVWNQLESDVLSKSYAHPCGANLRISCVLVDSGGQSDAKAFAKPVYQFVRRRQGRYVFACKGSSELGSPLVVGRLQKNGIMLQSVGGDVAKSIIYERLTIATPGPGYCHFGNNRGYDEEYFKQLTAEGVNISKGKRQWVKLRARNEGLDLRVYGHAAFEIRNVNLQAVSDNLRKQAVPIAEVPKDEPQAYTLNPKTTPQAMQRPRRRVGFAKW
jgi:phage terminase large subunit GpA-like protein